METPKPQWKPSPQFSSRGGATLPRDSPGVVENKLVLLLLLLLLMVMVYLFDNLADLSNDLSNDLFIIDILNDLVRLDNNINVIIRKKLGIGQ